MLECKILFVQAMTIFGYLNIAVDCEHFRKHNVVNWRQFFAYSDFIPLNILEPYFVEMQTKIEVNHSQPCVYVRGLNCTWNLDDITY